MSEPFLNRFLPAIEAFSIHIDVECVLQIIEREKRGDSMI